MKALRGIVKGNLASEEEFNLEEGDNLYWMEVLDQDDLVDNVFCPTGPGGGVDPSCSPGGGGGGKHEVQADDDNVGKYQVVGPKGIVKQNLDFEAASEHADELNKVGTEKVTPTPDNVKVVQTLGGSTGAKLVESPSGHQYIMKGPKDSETAAQGKERLTNEVEADAVYNAMGISAPISHMHGDNKFGEWITGQELGNWEAGKTAEQINAVHKEIAKNFVADALMGNWDVIGLTKDNILITGDGKVVRADNGGALKYRAQGTPKGDKFGNTVVELESMRNPYTNPQGAKIFGKLTNDEINQQIKDVVGKKDKILDAIHDTATKAIMEKRIASLEAKLKGTDFTPPITQPAPTSTPKAAPVSAPAGKGVDYNDPHSIGKSLLDAAPKGSNFSELYVTKLAHLSPKGIVDGTIVVPMLSTTNKAKAAKQMEGWQKVLPPGTVIKMKKVTTGELAATKGIEVKKGEYKWKEVFKTLKLKNEEEGGTFTFSKPAEKPKTTTTPTKSAPTPAQPTGPYKPKESDLPAKPSFISKNAEQVAANDKAATEMKALALDGNKAGLEAHPGTPSQKLQQYKKELLQAMEPPPPPPEPGTFAGGYKTSTPGSVKPDSESYAAKYFSPPSDGKITAPISPAYEKTAHEAWVKSLNSGEAGAIQSWKGTAKTIRTEISTGKMSQKSKNFLSAISKSAPYQGTVYRGLHSSWADTCMANFEKLGIGGEFVDSGPHCTSIDPGVATGFSYGKLVLRIKTQTARPIQGASGFESEKEAVGMPGTKYKITAVHKKAKINGVSHEMVVDLEDVTNG